MLTISTMTTKTMRMIKRLSTEQLANVQHHLTKKIEKSFAGGLRYGWDMPTAILVFPHLALVYRLILAEFRARQQLMKTVSEQERAAIERLWRAKVKASESVMIDWIRAVGPDMVLRTSLKKLRDTANSF